MTDLITEARELCEGGKVDPQIVCVIYELCEALEESNTAIKQIRDKVRQIVTGNAITAVHMHKQIEHNIIYGDGKEPKGIVAALQESEKK